MKTAVKYFLCVMLLGGCVATDINRLAEFSNYQTYAWGESKQNVGNPIYRSDLIDNNIKQTMREELSKKGLIYKKSRPDILVSYETFTETEQRYTGPVYSPYYPAYPFWSYSWFGYGWRGSYGWYAMPMSLPYTKGTLVIDVYDRKTGMQIWRGSTSDDLDGADRLNKQIQKGVRAILRKFPAGTPPEPVAPLKEKVVARAGQ